MAREKQEVERTILPQDDVVIEYTDKAILPQDDVVIEYTDKAQYHQAGDTEKVHRYLAEQFVKKGIAKIKKS